MIKLHPKKEIKMIYKEDEKMSRTFEEGIIKLYTRQEVADFLNISTKTLGIYKKLGRIKSKRAGNKDVYTSEEINRFITEEM